MGPSFDPEEGVLVGAVVDGGNHEEEDPPLLPFQVGGPSLALIQRLQRPIESVEEGPAPVRQGLRHRTRAEKTETVAEFDVSAAAAGAGKDVDWDEFAMLKAKVVP